ncbi:Flp pilus assembly protein CpaB [Paraburkholderia lycopersici]|uniref:Pilus assembly protein CpaB n=1 Tax=Paraburkholderia lycopersici TaxID=416944 RepID=A0A1G6VZR1_9BURK|nr:Flp pilus assembly protein CpaB [Paraburkholderia lycopersici]SDD59048.1 pilus assembly protein CpaB [Paraburkholderia lycopersici]
MSKIIKLAVLLVGALLVALMVRFVVKAMTTPHSQQPPATKRVRVAAADLPAGLLLRDADLAWKEMPAASVRAGAQLEGDTANAIELKGALLRQAVSAGQPVLSDEVILPGDPGFLAATLKPGMRAVSVAIDEVSGNAGLIEPGDYVDLLLTQQMSGRTDEPALAVSSETIVQHVRVLAVGSVIQRPKTDGNTPDAGNRARTVTLEVTPERAEVVSVAARLGSLSLALRSFAVASRNPGTDSADAASAPPAPVWAGDISRAVRALPRPAGNKSQAVATGQAVMIYRGSQKNLAEDSTVPLRAGGQVPPLPTQPLPQ